MNKTSILYFFILKEISRSTICGTLTTYKNTIQFLLDTVCRLHKIVSITKKYFQQIIFFQVALLEFLRNSSPTVKQLCYNSPY